MDNSEIESFITKFRVLWNSGLDAHLEVNSHAGQAWVSLRVRLGHDPGPLQPHHQFEHPPSKSRNSPSRQRRRARRAAARAEQGTAAEANDPIEKNRSESIEKNISEHVTLRDEFCSDKTFDEEEKSSLNKENIEDHVDKIVVTFGDESDQKIEVTGVL